MIMQLLEALLESWLATETAVDIGSDPEKVRLLKHVSDATDGESPSPFVRDTYQEVFLRDVWIQKREVSC